MPHRAAHSPARRQHVRTARRARAAASAGFWGRALGFAAARGRAPARAPVILAALMAALAIARRSETLTTDSYAGACGARWAFLGSY